MINWKIYKILSKEVINPNNSLHSFIKIELDGYISTRNYCDGLGSKYIFCVNRYPFDTYQAGDSIEINHDRVISEESTHLFHNGEGAIRKLELSSLTGGMTIGSTTITREHGLAIARQLDAYVDQSGGRNEYTAHIEVNDNQGKPIKFSLSSKRANNKYE